MAASLESSTKDGMITCPSWGTGRFDLPTIAVGSAGGGVVIYRYADAAQRSWVAILHFQTGTNILSIAWAPNVGRPFNWLAVAVASRHGRRPGRLQAHERKSGEAAGGNRAKCEPANRAAMPLERYGYGTGHGVGVILRDRTRGSGKQTLGERLST
jgi:hypothetical protein